MIGNIMADFSSRGPYVTEPNWIKPDVTAPGVQMLAGETPEPNDGSTGDFFQYLQGTSMATPHVAGIGALLREAHPDWTPAIVKSALMTTAGRRIVKEDVVTKANPFDLGSGTIVPNLAVDPGLVYDSALYRPLGRHLRHGSRRSSRRTTASSSRASATAWTRRTSTWRRSASTACLAETVDRTVTNVSDTASTYTASFVAARLQGDGQADRA